VEAAPAPEEAPQQLTDRWEVLQPVENALYAIKNGPLTVKI
jgi:hypothetical protein